MEIRNQTIIYTLSQDRENSTRNVRKWWPLLNLSLGTSIVVVSGSHAYRFFHITICLSSSTFNSTFDIPDFLTKSATLSIVATPCCKVNCKNYCLTMLVNSISKFSPVYHASPFISFEGINYASIYTFIARLETHFTPFIKSRASIFFNVLLTCGCCKFVSFFISFVHIPIFPKKIMTWYMSISSNERLLSLTNSSFVCCF